MAKQGALGTRAKAAAHQVQRMPQLRLDGPFPAAAGLIIDEVSENQVARIRVDMVGARRRRRCAGERLLRDQLPALDGATDSLRRASYISTLDVSTRESSMPAKLEPIMAIVALRYAGEMLRLPGNASTQYIVVSQVTLSPSLAPTFVPPILSCLTSSGNL